MENIPSKNLSGEVKKIKLGGFYIFFVFAFLVIALLFSSSQASASDYGANGTGFIHDVYCGIFYKIDSGCIFSLTEYWRLNYATEEQLKTLRTVQDETGMEYLTLQDVNIKGEKGDPGPEGPAGPAGMDGSFSSTGLRGPIGPAGEDGKDASEFSLGDLENVDVRGSREGDLLYFDGSDWVDLNDGDSGEVLASDGDGDLYWVGNVSFFGSSIETGEITNGTIADEDLDLADITLNDFTNDAGFLTVESDPNAVLSSVFTANGDLLYGTGAGTYTNLGVGADGEVLTLTAGVPSWATPGVALSSLTAAISANSINNGDNAQTWNWNLTNNDKAGITFGEDVASTGTGTSIVGISNLASSTAMPLFIENLGAGDSFRVDDASSDTSPFLIDENGNVMIGTETLNPVYPEKFRVDSATTGNPTVISGSGDLNNVINMNIQNRNAGTGALSIIGALADNGNAFSNNISMGIASSGFSSPIIYPILGDNDAFIVSTAKDMVLGNATAGYGIKFITGNGFQNNAERMIIDSSGNVGIGTTNPGSELDVKGTFRLSGATSGYVGFAPATAAGSTIYTLPSADGTAGQALITDGSAGLSWASATSNWQLVGTTLSPITTGDDVTTSGDIYTTGTGTITSAGLLTGSLGATISGAVVSLNDNSNFNTTINSGTSTGTVSIGSVNAGAISITSGAGLTLAGGATSSFSTTAGDINLQPAGTGTANVQIGDGGVTSATPDMLVLDIGSADPVGTNGAMYYSTSTNNFRCFINGSWNDCASARLSSINAALSANSINNGDNAQIWNWNLTTAGKTGFTFGENTASTGVGTSILQVSNLASSTAVPLVVNNIGAVDSFRVNDSSADTTPFIINEDGNVAIGATSFDPTNPEKLKVEAGTTSSINVISGYGDIDNYLQLNIKNRNSGGSASSDLVATADNGDENVYYLDMGINSSGYNDAGYTIGGPNDSYILAQGGLGAGGNLAIGTGTAGTLIKFYTGGSLAANEKMRIEDTGYVGIATTSPGSELDVKGTLRLSGATSGYVGFAPASVAGSTTYILPSADGNAGDRLGTDGSGNLSWVGAGGYWQRVGTILSPTTAGDDITTSGDIYTTGTGTITSAGLLTGNTGLAVSGGDVNINTNSNFNTYIGAGTTSGTVNIGNSLAGAIVIESASTVTLQGGANTFTSPLGEIKIQPAGTGTTGLVKIGEGGLGSTAPDLLALDVKSTAGDPGSGTNGAMYYNANSNTFRCYVNGSWGDCDTTGGTVTLQSAYNSGPTITTAGSTDIALTLTSGNFTASGAGSVNLTPTGASSFTSGGALTLTGGATSTWGTSSGNLNLQVAGTGTANVQIGDGGTASATPDMLVLDVGSAEPAGTNGAMYYSTALNAFRCYENGGWQNCGTAAASATTLQQAYVSGNTITTALADGDFNVSGTEAVNLTPTKASQFTSGGALTLTGGATSTWGTTAGNLNLQVAGTGTTANVQIGAGGAGSTTPDLFALDVKSDAGDPAGFNGAMYYNTNANRFRCYQEGVWKDCDKRVTAITLQDVYDGGATITTAGATDIAFTLASGNFTVGGLGSTTIDPTGGVNLGSATSAVNLPGLSASSVVFTDASKNLTSTGTVAISQGGTGQTTKTEGFDALSPTTTKGDLIVNNGTDNVRLPVGGTDGFILVVDSTQGAGIKWTANTASADSLDFTEFKDAMTVDANTSINLAGQNLTINDLTGGGALSMTTNGAALTLTAGAASTWSTTAGALTVDSAAGLNLGTTNATGITIGKSGVTTTNIGTLQTGNAATTGSFKIADGSTNFITLTSPAISADYSLTLPVDDGISGQALMTDGSGNLSWSTIFVDPKTTRGDIEYRDATNTTARLPLGAVGTVLKSDGTDLAYATLTSTDVGLGNVTNDAQIPKAIGTAKGDLIAYTASNTPVRLPVSGTNGFVLTADSTQATGMKWSSIASSLTDALDFTEFSDAMTLDASTSIALGGNTLSIIGAGTVNVSADASAASVNVGTGAAAKTVTVGSTNTTSTTNIQSGSGNINLLANGTSTGNVQVGDGGAASATPDLLVLDTGSAEPVGTNGAMYYSTALNKFRCYENGAWMDCISSSVSGSDLQISSTQLTSTTITGTTSATANNLGTVSVTPSTATGDVYVNTYVFQNSLSNTNQTLTTEIRTGNTCNAGSLLSSKTATITSGNGSDGPGIYVTALAVDPGASAQTYVVCVYNSVASAIIADGSVTAMVIDTGADLAEIYSTEDENLEEADVVQLDYSLKAGIKKTEKPYEKAMLGIIATRPGLLMGSVEREGVKALPVALSGRVPVKVTNENGNILAGDYLTSSSTPGYAMKATKAGPIIGQAMHDYIFNSDAGKVLTFIKNGYYDGDSIETVSSNFLSNLSDTEMPEGVTNLSLGLDWIKTLQTVEYKNQDGQINYGLISNQGSDAEANEYAQQMAGLKFDGFVAPLIKAIQEQQTQIDANAELLGALDLSSKNIVSTEDGKTVFKGMIVADTVKANTIEGLDVIVGSELDAVDQALVKNGKTVNDISEELEAINEKLSNDEMALDLKGLTVSGGATFESTVEFRGSTIFKAIAEFIDKVIFRKDVEMKGDLIVGGDTAVGRLTTSDVDSAGYAVIQEGKLKVEVVFEKPYEQKPVVTATLKSGVKLDWYRVTDESEKGFTIEVSPEAKKDIKFAWQAVVVQEIKTTSSSASASETAPVVPVVPNETAPIVPTVPAEPIVPEAPIEPVAPVITDTPAEPVAPTAPDTADTPVGASDAPVE